LPEIGGGGGELDGFPAILLGHLGAERHVDRQGTPAAILENDGAVAQFKTAGERVAHRREAHGPGEQWYFGVAPGGSLGAGVQGEGDGAIGISAGENVVVEQQRRGRGGGQRGTRAGEGERGDE